MAQTFLASVRKVRSKGAIGLKVVVIVGQVGVNMHDWCPRDQLRVDGGICQVGLPKGVVIIRKGWVEYVWNDIGKGYASYPTHARQDRPGFLRVFVAESRSRVAGG